MLHIKHKGFSGWFCPKVSELSCLAISFHVKNLCSSSKVLPNTDILGGLRNSLGYTWWLPGFTLRFVSGLTPSIAWGHLYYTNQNHLHARHVPCVLYCLSVPPPLVGHPDVFVAHSAKWPLMAGLQLWLGAENGRLWIIWGSTWSDAAKPLPTFASEGLREQERGVIFLL